MSKVRVKKYKLMLKYLPSFTAIKMKSCNKGEESAANTSSDLRISKQGSTGCENSPDNNDNITGFTYEHNKQLILTLKNVHSALQLLKRITNLNKINIFYSSLEVIGLH